MRLFFLALTAAAFLQPAAAHNPDYSHDSCSGLFPDGSPIPEWFSDTASVAAGRKIKEYRLTDYNIFPDGRLHTREIQALIDYAAASGGGMIVVPKGVFMSGGLHFRQGTHLHIEEGGTLMGSDFIGDYPLGTTRIEGETCVYFGALINVDGLDGFTISGKGTIDGNGLRYHQQFWMRQKWNPDCTNKDEQRPRLVYISNSSNVAIEDVNLQNSPYWTLHLYRCENVRIAGASFFSLGSPDMAKGPSTDGIDLDVVRNVHIKDCSFSVNDDAIALKGGKGPWADDPEKSEGNGPNFNVIIEDCSFGFCHSCLTMGSESVHSRNIIMRRCTVSGAYNLMRLKMRPDTPQMYEYISIEDCCGSVDNVLFVRPWTQFYDLKDRKDIPMSYGEHIRLLRCRMNCNRFFNFTPKDSQYRLSDFLFEDIDATAAIDCSLPESHVRGLVTRNVRLTLIK